MLVELRIQHFALLEKIELSFYPGESVVTGETGSGKSLFVDALDFLRGARSERRILHEARPAIVEAVFIPASEPSVTVSGAVEEPGSYILATTAV